MPLIGYHASHEQFSPSDLLQYVQAAEKAGFDAAMCSDHFHPWSPEQGNAGFAWSWLGAALQATGLSFGTVNAPGYRYHPAIIAQAAATLSFMYPGRFWLAVGSGESLNESITGERWPPKQQRNERLKECADIMRALWAGETVNHRGLVTVEQATLYTRPPNPPKLLGAAITPETAGWLAEWADGLITIAQEKEAMEEVVQAWRDGGGRDKPMYLQAFLSWTESAEEALRNAHEQWRMTLLGSGVLAELRLPEHFDVAAEFIDEEDVEAKMRVSADLDQQTDWLRADIELGFERIYLHNVSPGQHRFIETFGERVLPELRKQAAMVG
jgi:coenzyme F420-dependent glucose-6-phosphate dehydrogenase